MTRVAEVTTATSKAKATFRGKVEASLTSVARVEVNLTSVEMVEANLTFLVKTKLTSPEIDRIVAEEAAVREVDRITAVREVEAREVRL